LLLTVSVSLLFLTGCGSNPLSLLTGGGPNVAANTQVGKTNVQTIGKTEVAPTVTVRPKARVETIDQSREETTNNELPPYLWIIGILLFIVGWVTDTPATYMKNFRRKKDG